MSEVATKEKHGINEATQTLADRIRAAAELDVTSGIVTQKEDANIYHGHMEEVGITKETLDTVKKAEATICAASTLAVGIIGVEAMEKHKDLNHVQMVTPMYGDEKFTAGVHRETVSRNVKTGEPITVMGQTHTGFAVTSSANRGQMAKVRSHIKELANQSLNNGK